MIDYLKVEFRPARIKTDRSQVLRLDDVLGYYPQIKDQQGGYLESCSPAIFIYNANMIVLGLR